MTQVPDLGRLFPREGELPAQHRIEHPVHQRVWLLDGHLQAWSGECKPVLSPV